MTHIDGQVKNPWKRFTQIMWSRNPSGKAIVFVHGFIGGYSTFEGFHSMILSEPNLSGHDIFFVEYKWGDRALLTGSAMKDFFNSLFVTPKQYFSKEFKRIGRDPQPYTQLTIVAHSLGAIVSRFALLEAESERLRWVDNTKMVLFAPAHLGADIIALGADALGAFGFLGAAVPLFKARFPSLIDLDATHPNETLDSLKTRTQALFTAGRGQFTIAQEVLFGSADRVVIPGHFCNDRPFRSIPSLGHKGICKPTPSFKDPFKSVLNHI